ncbi:MAG: metallopeptidase family protein [Acidimicrobiales bacterium]
MTLGFLVVIDVPVERFEELVGTALDGIPPELGNLMDNVAVFVEEGSTHSRLLGLYQGIPLTKRDRGYEGMVMPDRITIYRLPILAGCHTEDDVVRQVRITVVHEVGHHELRGHHGSAHLPPWGAGQARDRDPARARQHGVLQPVDPRTHGRVG